MSVQRQPVAIVILIVIIIYSNFPTRFATHYTYLKHVDILNKDLVKSINKNSLNKTDIKKCDYFEVIQDNKINADTFNDNFNNEILVGGEYTPTLCNPSFSSAIIVPYRDRIDQLNTFLKYIHSFLRRQNIHYRIFIIDQFDKGSFNRAKLLNIGALTAARFGYPCLILHDVDLLPLNTGNIYACTQQPRHMSANLDTFRFTLPYKSLFGGVVAIQTETFNQINGMSNMFAGWGGEDDDFFERLQAEKINICRFAPSVSRYTMLRHTKAIPSNDRYSMLQNGPLRYRVDGLNSLKYKEIEIVLHPLFTQVVVEL